MQITIESTDRIVEIEFGEATVKARIWEGKTASGIPVICMVTRIAVPNGHPMEQFDRELESHKPPSPMAIEAIPLRMII